jgi:accessory gene regulator B
MTQSAAVYLSKKLIKYGVIAENQLQIYAYGLELVLSTIVNLISVLLLSLIFLDPLSGAFFLLAFIPLRTTAGGYHAKTHWGCGLVFIVAFTASLLLIHFIGAALLVKTIPFISIFSFFIVIWLSPVEAKNKPLTDKQRKQNRTRSIFIAAINLLLAFIVYLLPQLVLINTIACYYLGIGTATVSIVAVQIQHIAERS